MRSLLRLRRITGALLLAFVLLCAGLPPAAAAPAAAPSVAACTLVGVTRRCELWARAGTLSLSGAPAVPIWGYAASAAGPASLPGPTIEAVVGELLEVTLHNELGEPSALAFPGMALASDSVGVAPGATRTYTLTVTQPGTFLYQAGLTPGGARQVAMGLYGALLVRPTTPGTAYDLTTAYDDEALLVYSEIDPAFNAAPASFPMQQFAPVYLLINGRAYPESEPLLTGAGRRVLLRQINAGLHHRSLGLLGLRQRIIATDGAPLAQPFSVVAETLAPGQTLDSLVSMPAGAAVGTRYPLYATGMPGQGPGGPAALGGMLTFLTLQAAATPDTAGPATSAISVTPALSNGASPLQLIATISDVASGNGAVTAAEYFLDTVGADGTGTPITAGLGASSVSLGASIPLAALAGLADGPHTVFVHGRDAAGNWGASASASFTLDRAAPGVSGLALAPARARFDEPVTFTLSASDPATIAAGEYFIGADPGAGAGQPLSPSDGSFDETSEELQAILSLNALAPGTYSVGARARDAAGNWSAPITVALEVHDTYFSDGFESGDVSAWTSTGGNGARLSVTSAAAMDGTALGMRAVISAGTSGFVEHTMDADRSAYRARFYLDLSGATLGTAARTVFVARDTRATPRNAFQVQVRYNNNRYQVRVVVARTGGNSSTSWRTISGPTAVEVGWSSATSGSLTLALNGVLQQTLSNLNTSGYLVRAVRLGPQGNLSGASGTIHFDEFVATRSTVVGP